jgi:hypothetical protein
MKDIWTIGALLIVISTFASVTPAQESRAAAQRSITLRFQLLEVQAQIEPLLLRAQELNELEKPETIERNLALTGSTKPEEVRDQLHRQFSLEADSVSAQLKRLEQIRSQLESAIATTDSSFKDSMAVSLAPPESSAERVDSLNKRLEVQTKMDELQLRLMQLDYDLRPENIERALAGIGSARPEELREQRRRLLTAERNSVLTQIKLLESIRSLLEQNLDP